MVSGVELSRHVRQMLPVAVAEKPRGQKLSGLGPCGAHQTGLGPVGARQTRGYTDAGSLARI